MKRFRKVSYWRERQNEIDFVVEDGDELYAVEVKAGRSGKQNGLTKFSRTHPHAVCITLRDTKLGAFLSGTDLRALAD